MNGSKIRCRAANCKNNYNGFCTWTYAGELELDENGTCANKTIADRLKMEG